MEDSYEHYLLVLEKDSGKWKIPTETLEDNESPEDAIIRGVKEETGYNVELVARLAQYSYRGSRGDLLERIDFYARCKGGDLCVNHTELKSASWLDLDDYLSYVSRLPVDHLYRRQLDELLKCKERGDLRHVLQRG